MYHADKPQDSADLEPQSGSRTGHRGDDEIVVERRPIAADTRQQDADSERPAFGGERRRGERRRIDRMSTGI